VELREIIAYLQNYRGGVKIMEACGTHTASVVKNGVHSLISGGIRLMSGPGCPACVTPPSVIDGLIACADDAEVLSFGDLFHLPGSGLTLAEAKARGGRVRLMYSPFEILERARGQRADRFVIAAVGFETTAPVYAALMEALIREDIRNVRLYTALKTMPEILGHIAASEDIDAFICPGHVSAVIGSNIYRPLCEKTKKPFVIAGFEPEHVLAAIYEIVKQRENDLPMVKNLYPSVVSEHGQAKALELTDKYFEKTDSMWRGIGLIGNSGYTLRSEYARFSANPAPSVTGDEPPLPRGCRCAGVMLGRISPDECALYGLACTPKTPVGACMASSEGACAIWMGRSA